ncbi:MAG: Malto-oligosyltrehalose trehalohydrolase [Pseudomonadota bacterium]
MPNHKILAPVPRRLPLGAEVLGGGSTHFRVWAPDPVSVVLVIEIAGERRDIELIAEPGGYFHAAVPGVGAGARYWYRLDGELVPDPASRYQPDGPFGPSEVVDSARFAWTDGEWRGVSLEGQVIYELHIGTFTPEGTWKAAIDKLPLLAGLGITVLEVMPVSEFPGRFGWGYDGVFPYASTHLYGSTDDFRAFVDCAHVHGLAVILDVVYNHLGPSGCVFRKYAKAWYTARFDNEWGDALNFNGDEAAPAREFWCCNAGYWIDEFHLDGLRLDATQAIHDDSPQHIIAAMSQQAHAQAKGRGIILVAENEPQHVRLVQPVEAGGYGLDGLWNDDLHHSAVVALTGRREAYYSDHRGTPQEFVSAARRGYLFQGQRYAWQKQARGTRVRGIAPSAFINFIENHDQVANWVNGARMHQRTSPGRLRAITAFMLLAPGTPMLFQGQEFASSRPFLYFADHEPELAAAVLKGRSEFLSQFPSIEPPEARAALAEPHAGATFERCKLDWRDYEANAGTRQLHADLIALRRNCRAFRPTARELVDGAVLDAEAFVLRYLAASGDDLDERLLIVNLGVDLVAESFAEPLIAPPDDCEWKLAWSSEAVVYGGVGTPDVTREGWRVPGHSAVVLRPERTPKQSDSKAGNKRSQA